MRCFLILLYVSLNIVQVHAQNWTKLTDLPAQERSGASSFVINDKLYIGGGRIPSNLQDLSFWEYDPGTKKWTKKADMPGTQNARWRGVGFAINGKGYVGMGFDDISQAGLKNDLWEYDPTSDSWTQKATLPAAGREGSGCAVLNNKAYLIGGEDGSSSIPEVWEYDPSANKWIKKANYPAGNITGLFAFSVNGKIFTSCGFQSTVSNPFPNEIVKTYEFDPVSNTWKGKSDFIGNKRSHGVSFVVNGMAYCGLGISNIKIEKDIYSYNSVTDTWKLVGDAPFGERDEAMAATILSKGYVGMGSKNNNTNYNDLWEFSAPAGINHILKNQELILYPNPTTGIVHLSFNETTDLAYKVYDNLGKCIQNGLCASNEILDISQNPSGLYMIQVNCKGKSSTHPVFLVH